MRVQKDGKKGEESTTHIHRRYLNLEPEPLKQEFNPGKKIQIIFNKKVTCFNFKILF
jgi:hypothetical protein